MRILLLGAGLLPAACGESDEAPAGRPAAVSHATPPASSAPSTPTPSSPASPSAGPSSPTPSSPAPAAREWLEMGDATPPQAWLAARIKGTDGTQRQAAEARLQQLLQQADAAFHETPRMLANRTAQLQQMLADIAVAEPPELILQGFIPLGHRGRPTGYADLCQHYFNLRKSGLDRAAALRALDAASSHDGAGPGGRP